MNNKSEYVNKNFRLSKIYDQEVLGFLNKQPSMKQTESFRLGIEVLSILFGDIDITNVHKEIKRIGLVNVLEKRLQELKENKDYEV
jgi:hypothetical protein